ncbi:hypothetical protein AB0D04_25015 [Streptomyces sp. NPDC048483]|uniref:hypothetical protein n=1 Tax=Streptomyces sp. NPDC048483 TaxID=3154927 RepID=UPI0034488FD1
MYTLRKAAVVVAVLGSVGLLGAGTAYAGSGTGGDYRQEKSTGNESSYGKSKGSDSSYDKSSGGDHGKSKGGDKIVISQGTSCRSEDTNVDVLGEVGVANGLAGNLGGGLGSPGVQSTTMGSSMGCNNSVGE